MSGDFPLKVFLDVKFDDNKTANGALPDCFLHITWFHGRMNITSFTSTRKVIYFLRQFSRYT